MNIFSLILDYFKPKHVFGNKPDVQRSSKWPATRKTHLIKNPICAACGTKNNLEVHHIYPFQNFPELELEPTNLLTLCETHHICFGHFMLWKSWNGNVIEDCNNYFKKLKERP